MVTIQRSEYDRSADLGYDQKVGEWIWEQFLQSEMGKLQLDGLGDPADVRHLRECAGTVLEFDGMYGQYGCETGCDYARFEATLTCPHEAKVDVKYGDWGELPDLLQDIFGDPT